jgi:hypothetical protein
MARKEGTIPESTPGDNACRKEQGVWKSWAKKNKGREKGQGRELKGTW